MTIRNASIRNVFDEMYYAVDYSSASSHMSGASFSNMNHLAGRPDLLNGIGDDVINFVYDEQFLRQSERIGIYVNVRKKEVRFVPSIKLPNAIIYLRSIYYVETKTLDCTPLIISEDGYIEAPMEDKAEQLAFLEENGLTKEDIEEYQRYFLYDCILESWIDGNGINTGFSKKHLGSFSTLDRIWENLE